MWAGAYLRVSRTVTRAADQAPPSVISDVLAAAVPNVGALYAAFDDASFAWSIASWSPSHIRHPPTPISRAAAKKPMPTASQLTFTGGRRRGLDRGGCLRDPLVVSRGPRSAPLLVAKNGNLANERGDERLRP